MQRHLWFCWKTSSDFFLLVTLILRLWADTAPLASGGSRSICPIGSGEPTASESTDNMGQLSSISRSTDNTGQLYHIGWPSISAERLFLDLFPTYIKTQRYWNLQVVIIRGSPNMVGRSSLTQLGSGSIQALRSRSPAWVWHPRWVKPKRCRPHEKDVFTYLCERVQANCTHDTTHWLS